MKIAFLVPSTSNGKDWKNFRDSYLNQILFPSITKLSNSFEIEVYIGYDHDDRIYSNVSLPETYDNLKLKYFPFDSTFKGKPTHIWNYLAKRCIADGHEYMQVCGDDISFDFRTEWLGLFIKELKKKDNFGYISGWSNNDNIPTQFLFHKKHYELFGFIFPPQIHNWFCDDFIFGLYGQKGMWNKTYRHLNIGGEPRYTPRDDKQLCQLLIKRYRKLLK